MQEAVELAIADNPTVRMLNEQAASHTHYQDAAKGLPTPVLRTGLMNLPVDDPSLDSEPMTQGVIGVRQIIPPKGVRAAQQLNHQMQAMAMQYLAQAEQKDTVYDTRATWLSVYLYEQEIQSTVQAQDLLRNLSQIVHARYAAGDELQVAVLAAELEQSRLQNRLLETRRLQQNALSELKEIVGLSENLSVGKTLPQWDEVPDRVDIEAALGQHPKLKAAHALMTAGSAEVEQTQAKLNPEWHFDLSYGLRSGQHLDGRSKSDLASATLSVSLPWLTKQANHSRIEAARANERSADQARIALFRNLMSDIRTAYADWQSLSGRMTLLNQAIVPQSQQHARAALQAYQNKEANYTDVLLSYVDEVEARLELHQVQVSLLKTWAKIDALNGQTP